VLRLGGTIRVKFLGVKGCKTVQKGEKGCKGDAKRAQCTLPEKVDREIAVLVLGFNGGW
jgi:hypothetical protein